MTFHIAFNPANYSIKMIAVKNDQVIKAVEYFASMESEELNKYGEEWIESNWECGTPQNMPKFEEITKERAAELNNKFTKEVHLNKEDVALNVVDMRTVDYGLRCKTYDAIRTLSHYNNVMRKFNKQ